MTISPRIAVSCALAVDWLIVFMARQSVALFAAFVRSCSFTAVPFPLLMPPSLPPWLVLCALRCSAVLAVLSLDLLAVLTALAYLLCLLCCPLLAVLLRCCAHLHFHCAVLAALCSLCCARCARCAHGAVLLSLTHTLAANLFSTVTLAWPSVRLWLFLWSSLKPPRHQNTLTL